MTIVNISFPLLSCYNTYIVLSLSLTLFHLLLLFSYVLPLSSSSLSNPSNYNMSKVNRSVSNDPAARIQNLQLLVNRIKHFYLTDLQQLIITPLPKIGDICANPREGESPLADRHSSWAHPQRATAMDGILLCVWECCVRCMD